MKIRQDNRGLSLVELIIAITVTTIIFGAVTMFIYSANKSYKLAGETIDLQIEAQLLMEQVGNWVMESNDACVVTDSEAVGNVLVLYDIPLNNGRDVNEWVPTGYTPGSTDATKRVIWSKDGKLFMKKVTGITNAATDKSNVIDSHSLGVDLAAESANEENMIGELVNQIVFTHDATNEPKRINIEFFMKKGNLSYHLVNDFKIRNGM